MIRLEDEISPLSVFGYVDLHPKGGVIDEYTARPTRTGQTKNYIADALHLNGIFSAPL